MLSVEVNNVQAAINAPLPSPPLGSTTGARPVPTHSQADSADEQEGSDNLSDRSEVNESFKLIGCFILILIYLFSNSNCSCTCL